MRAFFLSIALCLAACQSGVGRAAVSMSVKLSARSPGDASVFIDEEYVGPLGFIAVHGVRLPVGEHRITVQKEGFFPWDRLVVADREAVRLDVDLEPVPD
ncbi:MAG: PEGA domain-containing protein [Polyangiaceae bacterium]|nr:PEGA domain-containing protein [Polyangiaceae bacterium]